MPSVERLKQRLNSTLKAKKIQAALLALAALAEKQPEDPVWPKCSARLLRATDDPDGELVALRRALDLEVDQRHVVDAIATCRSILEVEPADERTLDCLDLLNLSGAPADPSAACVEQRAGQAADVPLDSLLLTQVVPGARSVQIADAAPGCINEIPIEASHTPIEHEVVDLRLEQWSSSGNQADREAARAACLPTAADPARSSAARSQMGSPLRAELANVPLFGDLDPPSLQILIRRVRIVELEAGQVLFRQGDAANSLYVVVEGAVVPIAEGQRRRKLAVLERGEFFGEIGLMTKQPRNATIEALVDTKLLAIDRRVLWELIEKEPSVVKCILRFLRARLIDRQIRTSLFFGAFVHAEREAVARQFRILEVGDGTRIIEQGKPPEGLFVVLSGCLELRDRKLDKEVGILTLGDVFGGLSLLAGEPAAADVVARGKCWLVVLGEGRFRRILEANPRLVRVLRRLGNGRAIAGRRPGVAAL